MSALSEPTPLTDIIIIRKATNADLPSIRDLIRDSFYAILDYVSPDQKPYFDVSIQDMYDKELNESSFENIYFASGNNYFWVAESMQASLTSSTIDSKVQGEISTSILGCVGLKRISYDEAELERMAVSPHIRGSGVGAKLVSTLKTYCRGKKISYITLTTANIRAANFYSKNGFQTIYERAVPIPNMNDLKVSFMCYYIYEKLIKKVVIVGGTHGRHKHSYNLYIIPSNICLLLFIYMYR